LFSKLQLLERVIRARKLHHDRFFAENIDYGHKRFLDGLVDQRRIVGRALERLERRSGEVLYKQKKWYSWVRECQDEEEKHKDKEQKKVKQEAAMFKRHWKAAQLRMRDLKAKEDKKRQDAFLDQVYMERLKEMEKNGTLDDDEIDWDPIEDVLEDNRGSYIGKYPCCSFLFNVGVVNHASRLDSNLPLDGRCRCSCSSANGFVEG